MSVLVDELLLLAQRDAGRPLAREPVDLSRLAIDATDRAPGWAWPSWTRSPRARRQHHRGQQAGPHLLRHHAAPAV
jgi:hypothetical protein